ncbi:MAG: hypothetical protein ABI680_03800 [Chthoniobacteraceae bacterium]
MPSAISGFALLLLPQFVFKRHRTVVLGVSTLLLYIVMYSVYARVEY